MFRGSRRATSAATGRPRARGDVPQCPPCQQQEGASTPRPRGCSSHRGPGLRLDERRPRARGDVPNPDKRAAKDAKSTPRPRGCSLRRGRRLRLVRVDPAPAGMFRRVRPGTSASGRRPRARGDVPPDLRAGTKGLASTPRPRGCSAPARVRGVGGAVDPAPAGMFPAAPASRAHSTGRPRARGDVPPALAPGLSKRLSTPRPRGCSYGLAHRRRRAPVDPAPAGMFRNAA